MIRTEELTGSLSFIKTWFGMIATVEVRETIILEADIDAPEETKRFRIFQRKAKQEDLTELIILSANKGSDFFK